MQLDAALSWLAMTRTPGLASRLSGRLLRRFESPEGIFRATLPQLRIVTGMPLGVGDRGWCGIPRLADHCPSGDGVRQGGFWGSRQRHAVRELGAEPADQTGSETGDQRGRCERRAPTPVCAALVKAEQPLAEQRNLLASEALNASGKTIFLLLAVDAPTTIDDFVERSGLHSSEVLATLFNLEMKSIVRQWPGKQFSKVML
jgi:predicted Rossmann fold nucleotide-binding protein DprA/Smf involved in DNA uptake